jgi:hypothetical protein
MVVSDQSGDNGNERRRTSADAPGSYVQLNPGIDPSQDAHLIPEHGTGPLPSRS